MTPSPSPIIATGPILGNIQATSITQTSAIITWVTDVNADSAVIYGRSTPNIELFEANFALSHAISISGLVANTNYYYRVKSCANGACTYSERLIFKTLRKLRKASIGPTGMSVMAVVNELDTKVDELKQSGEDTSEIESMISQSIQLIESGDEQSADSVITEAKQRTDELMSQIRGKVRASKFDAVTWAILLGAIAAGAYFLYRNRARPRRKARK